MRVLAAISILAFAALLWASVAIFRHVRRAQRRRRRSLEASYNNFSPTLSTSIIAPPPLPKVAPEISFNDPEAPPELIYTDPKIPPRELTPPANSPVARIVTPPQQAPTSVTEEFLDTLPPPPSPPAQTGSSFSPIPAWPHFGFTPSRPEQPLRSTVTLPAEPEHALAAEQALENQQISGRAPIPPSEPIPYAAPPLSESAASVTPARLPMLIHPPPPAVKPVYPSPYPAIQQQSEQPHPLEASSPPPVPSRPAHQPISRADWAYFNKDMGDLSDPAPAGSRSRIPAFVPQTPIKPKSS